MNEYDYILPTPGTIGELKLGRLYVPSKKRSENCTDTAYVIVISTAVWRILYTREKVPYVRLYSILNSKMILLPYGDYTNLVDTLGPQEKHGNRYSKQIRD